MGMAYQRTIHERIDMLLEKLFALETEHDCKIVFAVEAGSRAFGTSSPESDYDVRFIYKLPVKSYVAINQRRDTFNHLEPGFDFVGWDIRKAVTLASRSNCGLYEWFFCKPLIEVNPFVYDLREQFLKDNHKPGLFESYRGFSKSNYHQEIERKDTVKIKAYMYGFRGIAAMFALNTHIYPSIDYFDLVNYIPDYKIQRKLVEFASCRYKGEKFTPRDPLLDEAMFDYLKLECNIKKTPIDHRPYDTILFKELLGD